MKVKLIQSGGFIGKLKLAEEELTSYPDTVKKYFETNLGTNTTALKNNSDASHPDSFEYHLEYKGNRFKINNVVFPQEVQQIIDKLKDELHY